MRRRTTPTAPTLRGHDDDDEEEEEGGGGGGGDSRDPFQEMNLAGSTAAAARWMAPEERQL
eukprot:ctg_4862.g655